MEPEVVRPQQQRLAVWAGGGELCVGPAGTRVAGTHVSSTRRQWAVARYNTAGELSSERKGIRIFFYSKFSLLSFFPMSSLTCD